jgi:hypothetical protein
VTVSESALMSLFPIPGSLAQLGTSPHLGLEQIYRPGYRYKNAGVDAEQALARGTALDAPLR